MVVVLRQQVQGDCRVPGLFAPVTAFHTLLIPSSLTVLPSHLHSTCHIGQCMHFPAAFSVFIHNLAGCRYVASGPLVRSSYKAGEFFIEAMIEKDSRPLKA